MSIEVFIGEQLSSWAIGKVADAIFNSIAKAEDNIKKIQESPLNSGKEYMRIAVKHAANNNLSQAIQRLEMARPLFHEAANQNDSNIKLLSYCYAGLCSSLLDDDDVESKHYYGEALKVALEIEAKISKKYKTYEEMLDKDAQQKVTAGLIFASGLSLGTSLIAMPVVAAAVFGASKGASKAVQLMKKSEYLNVAGFSCSIFELQNRLYGASDSEDSLETLRIQKRLPMNSWDALD